MKEHATTLVGLATLLATAGHAAGFTDSESEADASRAEMIALAAQGDTDPQIAVSGELQFRYMSVFSADDPATASDEDFTSGFESSRTRLKFKGSLPDQNLSVVVLGNFSSSSGNFGLDDAYVDWAPDGDWKFRVGQFKLPFTREFYGIGPTKVLLTDRSLADAVFRADRSQGVMATWSGDRFRFNAAFSDGRRAKNSAYTASSESDAAITARAEMRFGDAGWGQYKDFTAFRGDANGVLVGVAGHWQQDGTTMAPSGFGDNSNYYGYTADVSWESNGFNVFGAFYGATTDSGDSVTDLGFTVHAGVFVSERNELFARYSHVIPDDDRGANSDDFSTISFGLNHYFIPESHAVKLTAEVGISPETQADSSDLVGTQSKLGLLADGDGGQVAASLQIQVLF